MSGWATVMGEVLRLGTTAAHYTYRTERSNQENHLIGVFIVCMSTEKVNWLALQPALAPTIQVRNINQAIIYC
eukprot:COSAG06_NODE_3999_length_4675_cov_2.774194_6_plen_73_part_00